MKKKKNWFRKHWILTGFGVIILLIILFAMIGGDSNSSFSTTNANELITINANSLIPQDSEIDREWMINPIQTTSVSSMGFVEGAERKISKAQDLSATTINLKAYRFDSIENANKFYEQEKEKINIRGVKEWNLGSGCFGIDKGVGLAGSAEGLCLRNNIVFYVKSSSSSFLYASDGKDFMNKMLKKV